MDETFNDESDLAPEDFEFDVAIVAVGYERRCRWVTESCAVRAAVGLGLEFGFLREGSFEENRAFFVGRSFEILSGVDDATPERIACSISAAADKGECGLVKVFIDISSMSREMIANVAIGVQRGRRHRAIEVTVAYAPSKYMGEYEAAPIRRASPIRPSLAGWSSEPEKPLGAIFGLGCEPGLALGALQFLEPNNAWVFKPVGTDPEFDGAMEQANKHIGDIFDVTEFYYEIATPTITRGRLEALLNALEADFRVIMVPFGPKIFAWLAIATVVFSGRANTGVWAFSSKEHATPVDRDANNSIVWHRFCLD